LKLLGEESREIVLTANDLHNAKTAYEAEKDVPGNAVRAINNLP